MSLIFPVGIDRDHMYSVCFRMADSGSRAEMQSTPPAEQVGRLAIGRVDERTSQLIQLDQAYVDGLNRDYKHVYSNGAIELYPLK